VYDKYGTFEIDKRAYWLDESCGYFYNKKMYMFYFEENPFPIYYNFDTMKPDITASTFSEALRTKFLDEITRAPNQILMLMIMAIINLVLTIIILMQLFGVFDKLAKAGTGG
jgi:hypothetical protein